MDIQRNKARLEAAYKMGGRDLTDFINTVAVTIAYKDRLIAEQREIITNFSRAAENEDLIFMSCIKHGIKYPSTAICPACRLEDLRKETENVQNREPNPRREDTS